MLNEIEKSYIAGIIDGEGSVGVRKIVKSILPRVQVGNTNFKLIKFLNDKCGGSIYSVKPKYKRWKSSWIWSLTGDKAIEFLIQIKSYLLLKKEQSDLVINSYGLLEKEERLKVFNRMTLLNKKGVNQEILN